MANQLDETPCPTCATVGTLVFVPEKLIAKPLGTWSLSGQQMKTSAYTAPVLECINCDFSAIGRYIIDDGKPYAVFVRPTSGGSP